MAILSRGQVRGFVSLGLASAIIAAVWIMAHARLGAGSRRPTETIRTATARRVELKTELLAGGDLQPVQETTVACKVDDLTKSGGTLIVSVVPNGTPVRRGDELCRLDSSGLEELARLEDLDVNQARALRDQARLSHEVAIVELREYQDGLMARSTQQLEGQIALARSSTYSLEDRLAWAQAMLAKGYVSKAEVVAAAQAAAKARHQLHMAEVELAVFRRYTAVRQVFALRAEIEKKRSVLDSAAETLRVREERLAYIRNQIEHCRVVAPHDGIAMYEWRNSWKPVLLEPGVRVKQDQELFTIPDLGRMDVEVSIHETMGHRVRVGQVARVQIASRQDREFTGRVASIAQLPTSNWKEWDERLKHYVARVRLDETPSNAFPLMSATVSIDTGGAEDALVVPVAAVATRDGSPSCDVVVGERREHRRVTIGRSTANLVEILSGLSEGDRVALGPGNEPANSR